MADFDLAAVGPAPLRIPEEFIQRAQVEKVQVHHDAGALKPRRVPALLVVLQEEGAFAAAQAEAPAPAAQLAGRVEPVPRVCPLVRVGSGPRILAPLVARVVAGHARLQGKLDRLLVGGDPIVGVPREALPHADPLVQDRNLHVTGARPPLRREPNLPCPRVLDHVPDDLAEGVRHDFKGRTRAGGEQDGRQAARVVLDHGTDPLGPRRSVPPQVRDGRLVMGRYVSLPHAWPGLFPCCSPKLVKKPMCAA